MNILVDWLTISIKKISGFEDPPNIEEKYKSYDTWVDLPKLLKILHLENAQMESGYSRWLGNRLYLGGITIHYGEYIILEMSGSGCRFLESLYDEQLNWIDFLEQFLCLDGTHISRLDIACDDKPNEGEKGVLSFNTMARHCNQHRYISRATKLPVLSTLGIENIVFGSSKSDRLLRIYNKALERGVDGHWIRAEFQLRNEAALSFYMRALECGSIGQAYQGMLFDYLRFTTKVNDSEHTERLIVTRWWRMFCGNAKKIKGFYVGGLEYNLESLERYLSNQTSSSMKTYLAAHGGDVTKLVEIAQGSTYNKKQKLLLKTQLLVDKMYEDYDAPELAAPKREVTPTEALAIAKANTEQHQYEERLKHWKPLGCSLDQQAAANGANIMSELAKLDLKF